MSNPHPVQPEPKPAEEPVAPSASSHSTTDEKHVAAVAAAVALSTPDVLSSVEKGKEIAVNDRDVEAVVGAQPVNELLGTDDAPNDQTSEWAGRLWQSRWRKRFIHFGLIALLLGWWIPGLIIRRQPHNKWVVTTIWTWFFILFILFHNNYVSQRPFVRVITTVWNTVLGRPWSMIPHYGKLAIGWIALLALFFGSAYGNPLNGSSYKQRTISLFGIFVFQCCFYLSSNNHKAVQPRQVIVGLGMQMILALLVFKTSAGFAFFDWIAILASDFLESSKAGAAFFFSEAFVSQPFFFLTTLPAIIFFIAFVQMCYYLGVMQWIISKFAWFFFKTMGISGAEAVVASASPFIGQGENACMVKPFVDYMTPSEIHQVLTSGFATISGAVMLAYINLGVPAVYIVTASVMSIPASIGSSKLRYPETEVPLTLGKVTVDRGEKTSDEVNFLHAFSNGAWFGLRVAGTILANVLVILSLLAAVDGLLTWIGQFWGIHELTIELVLGYVFYPFVWLLGVEGSHDILRISKLLATKAIANEFVAYTNLHAIQASADPIVGRNFIIVSYCLCGFANIGSLGINIGVLSGLAPSRSGVIARLAPSALVIGFITTCQTAAIAGLLA